MRCKSLLVPALAAMGAFIADGTVLARPTGNSTGGHTTVSHSPSGHGLELARGGGGRGGGGRGGGGYGRGGGGYGRGGGYGGYGGYGYGGYGGFGFWPGLYGGYGYGYGGPGYYGYDNGPAYYGPAYGGDYYGGGVVPYANAAPAPAPNVAGIHVIVPDPAARVWFDGVLTHQTGTDRWFHSAPLTTSGTYDIKASWMQDGHEMTQDRNVNVSPGQSVMVDFDLPVPTGK